jgi:predicted Abi (CAAX) family protease
MTNAMPKPEHAERVDPTKHVIESDKHLAQHIMLRVNEIMTDRDTFVGMNKTELLERCISEGFANYRIAAAMQPQPTDARVMEVIDVLVQALNHALGFVNNILAIKASHHEDIPHIVALAAKLNTALAAARQFRGK